MPVQSDTLFLVDVFENFRNVCFKLYEPHLAKFLAALGIAWEATLKTNEVKLDLLTHVDVLLKTEKVILELFILSIKDFKY